METDVHSHIVDSQSCGAILPLDSELQTSTQLERPVVSIFPCSFPESPARYVRKRTKPHSAGHKAWYAETDLLKECNVDSRRQRWSSNKLRRYRMQLLVGAMSMPPCHQDSWMSNSPSADVCVQKNTPGTRGTATGAENIHVRCVRVFPHAIQHKRIHSHADGCCFGHDCVHASM